MIPNLHFQSILPVQSVQDQQWSSCRGCGFKTKSSIRYHLGKRKDCSSFYNLDELKSKSKKTHTSQKENFVKRKAENEIMSAKKRSKSCIEDRRIENFKKAIREGPVYACWCCERNMFRDSISMVSYREARRDWENIYGKFFVEGDEAFKYEEDDVIYVCSTCKQNIKKEKSPAICYLNGLGVENIPGYLEMNELGATLIAKNILFLKLFRLPRSRWNALKDRVINVAVENEDIEKTVDVLSHSVRDRVINIPICDNDLQQALSDVDSLPRDFHSSAIIPVKLKRKLNFKSSVLTAYVEPNKMVDALKYLKLVGHAGYQDIQIKNFDLTTLNDDNEINEANVPDDIEEEIEDDNVLEQPTMFYENYPEIRIRQESGDNNTGNEISLAPGEGKIPCNLMRDENWDINAFPLLFPTGKFGLHYKRKFKISAQKYFTQRLLNKNNKFGRYPPWLFSALYFVERQQLEQQININYRRGVLKDRKILSIEDGFEVFDKISGTPRFWQQKRFEMVARLEQLKPFQFFLPSVAEINGGKRQ